jgi:hypothetical protein
VSDFERQIAAVREVLGAANRAIDARGLARAIERRARRRRAARVTAAVLAAAASALVWTLSRGAGAPGAPAAAHRPGLAESAAVRPDEPPRARTAGEPDEPPAVPPSRSASAAPRIRIEPGPDAVVESDGSRVSIASGRVRLASAGVLPDRVEVDAGRVRIEAYAWDFQVARSASGVEVVVTRGVVWVRGGGPAVRLVDGQRRFIAESDAGSASRPAALSLLDEADRARQDGDAAGAARLLRRIVDEHRGDPRAPLAAFTLGRVLVEDLDQPAAAARAFAEAYELAGGGDLAEDALAREVAAWALAGDRERARRRAELYAARYPSGYRLAEVRRDGGLP